MSTLNFDSIEYRCEKAFGGGIHIQIGKAQNTNDVYEFTDISVSGGYNSDRPARTRQLRQEEVERLVAAICAARISVFPPYVMGLDGATSTLRLVAGFSEITLRWWCNPEDGWEDLRRVVNAIQRWESVLGN
jgi:hypothetical protein